VKSAPLAEEEVFSPHHLKRNQQMKSAKEWRFAN
jgi:hypothetical protein